MSVWKPKNSAYFHCRFLVNGTWFRKSTKETDRKLALRKEKAFRKKYITKKTGERKDTTVGEAIKQYLATQTRAASYPSMETNGAILKEEFGARTPLDDITSAALTKFVTKQQSLGYANSTIKHRLQVLRGAINIARSHGKIVPELEYPKLKTKRGRTRVLSDDEIHAILNELNPNKDFGKTKRNAPINLTDEARAFRQDAYDLFLLFCHTGCRFTEISKLEWSQVNLTNKTIQVYRSKTDSEITLVLSDKAYEVMKRRADRPRSPKYVFPNKKGGPRGYTGSAIKKAIERATGDPSVTPHCCRHTFATRMLESGLNLQEVQYLLSHKDQSTTARYLHASTQQSAKRAADVLNEMRDALERVL